MSWYVEMSVSMIRLRERASGLLVGDSRGSSLGEGGLSGAGG